LFFQQSFISPSPFLALDSKPSLRKQRVNVVRLEAGGKLLAVGYTSCHVSVLDVESHVPLYSHQVQFKIVVILYKFASKFFENLFI
jgi:hypothetical protein